MPGVGPSGGRPRIEPEVKDISSHTDLVQYAVAGQVAWLERKGVSESRVAQAAGLSEKAKDAGSNLSSRISNKRLPPDVLQKLDEAIATLAPELERTGGLCSLALRLPPERRDMTTDRKLIAYVPPSWVPEILTLERPGEFASLIQGSALLSAFQAAGKIPGGQGVEQIRTRYGAELDELVDRLVLISVAPPTARNIDAQILLGSLASFAFRWIYEKLDAELRKQPLGFRVWRAVTKTVKISAPASSAPTDELRAWVAELLRNAKEIRKTSLYPGRSLDLELAITVPPAWVEDPDEDWVERFLLGRAGDDEATIRERGTAAMGLWERTFHPKGPDQAKTKQALEELIKKFKDEATRPDAATGLRWVATTLDQVMAKNERVCNEWPVDGLEWRRNVAAAAEVLESSGSALPPYLRKGTKRLFEHIVLQNAGVYRRQAIETVITGGWSIPVARALGELLRIEENESWLRIRALFALGFLQVRDDRAEEDLTQAVRHAYANFKRAPTRAQVTEMHAALFAVGDCFGVPEPDAQARAQTARDSLEPILRDLTTQRTSPAALWPAARAAAYMLTFTAQPKVKKSRGDHDLSEELLIKFRDHRDPLTRRLAQWALSFRFTEEGQVRPLLDAAKLGTRFSEPPRF